MILLDERERWQELASAEFLQRLRAVRQEDIFHG